jgi:enoyl-CoA hydratase/carnithine racemase
LGPASRLAVAEKRRYVGGVSEGVRWEVREDGIAVLTLDRPDKRNAVMPADWRALEERLDEGSADAAIRVFVLTGSGTVFSAGGDLKTMGERLEQSPVRRSREMLRMTRAIQKLRDTPKPIIAAVNGPAIGAGLVLALACDLRLAAASARFSAPFLRIGMVPDFGAAYFLPRLLGTARALELLWTHEVLDARAAAEQGLVNRVHPDDTFESEVFAFASRIAENPAGGLALSKLAVYHGAEQTLGELLDFEALTQTIASRSEDAREGVRAFVEKRAPRFRGE